MNAPEKNLDIDLAKIPELGEELMVKLDAIRETAPVFWSDVQQAWFVTRHEDVAAGFIGKFPLSSDRTEQIGFSSIPISEWDTRIPLLTSAVKAFANWTDPPRHARLRKPLFVALTSTNVEKIRGFVEQRVTELLDQVQDGRDFEFIDEFARPLTGSVIMRIMGMPEIYLGNLKDWAQSIVNAAGTTSPSVETLEHAERAMEEMQTAFDAELAKRKAEPSDDLLSVLAEVSEGEDPFTAGEMLGTCVNTLLAGHESTASTLAMGVAALVRNSDQISYLLEHPERSNETVAEISRFVAMSASQARVASEDFELQGEKIRKGDVVFLWNGAANRDPRIFDNPNSLDLSRDTTRSLVFGGGIHHCVGHLLAKLELCEATQAIFERFNVDILDKNLQYTGGYAFRTIAALNVRFRRRA